MWYNNLWLLALCYIALGGFAGLSSGMLGLGGGVVIVPGLAWVFHAQHFPEKNILHLAVGTSLAVMIFTTLRALYAHRRHRVPFWHHFRLFLPGVVVGVVIGATIGHFLHSQVIAIIFAIFLVFVAAYMFFAKEIAHHHQHRLPESYKLSYFGSLVGTLSGLLGIGGGITMVPFLIYNHISMREAVVVSIATGLTVSILGTVAVMITGYHAVGLPTWTTGYVYWPSWLGLVIGSMLFVPLGTKLSHRLPVRVLRKIFAIFLLAVSVHLFMIH